MIAARTLQLLVQSLPTAKNLISVMPLKSSRHSLLVKDVHGGGGDTTCCWWRSTLFFLSFIQILC